MCSFGEGHRLRPLGDQDLEEEYNADAQDDDPRPGVVYTKFDTCTKPDYVQESTFCCGLCCFKGCILAAIGAIYFFIVLPIGVLLLFHGVNKRRSLTLNIGVGILCIPTFLIVIIILLTKYCTGLRKDRRAEKMATKRTLAFENPLSRSRRADEDVRSSMC